MNNFFLTEFRILRKTARILIDLTTLYRNFRFYSPNLRFYCHRCCENKSTTVSLLGNYIQQANYLPTEECIKAKICMFLQSDRVSLSHNTTSSNSINEFKIKKTKTFLFQFRKKKIEKKQLLNCLIV